MIHNPLVSIVSPCWNGEKYVARMLDSIMNQSYDNIELICVDDGSTDNTKQIIFSYMEKYQKRRKKLIYIYQNNQGQAAALNTGIKKISGEYLAWIDCDDFLTEDSLEKRIKAFIEHPGYGVVTNNLYIVHERNINKIMEIKGERYGALNYQGNQFLLTLVGRSIMESHCQMLRVSDLRKINPGMEISTCKAGQNFQLLLPMLYYYKRYYIEEPLSYYVIRDDSHFHRKRTQSEWIERYDSLLDMLHETFLSMNLSEKEIDRYVELANFEVEKRRLM